MPSEPVAELPPAIRKPGRPPTKASPSSRNLTKRTRRALELMVLGDPHAQPPILPLPRAEAAKAVGITDNALYRAIRNPAGRQLLADLQDVLRSSLRPRALARIGALIEKADSDKVSLDAAKWIDGNGHEAKTAAVQVNVGVAISPGYQVRIGPEFADVVDVLPDTKSGADGG